jgi:hypothetical protein
MALAAATAGSLFGVVIENLEFLSGAAVALALVVKAQSELVHIDPRVGLRIEPERCMTENPFSPSFPLLSPIEMLIRHLK